MSVPKEQHSDQNKCRGNDIPDEVHPMDALAATVLVVFVVEIKLVLFHLHLLHRHCGEALHLFLEHEAGLVFLILDQFAKLRKVVRNGELIRNQEHKARLMFMEKVKRLSTMPVE